MTMCGFSEISVQFVEQ